MKHINHILFLLFAVIGAGMPVWAQDTAATAAPSMLSAEKIALVILLVAGAAILLVMFTLYRIIKLLSGELHKMYFAEKGIDIGAVEEKMAANQKTWWQSMMHALTDAVPVEREKDVLLDHDYDGIKELDNSLPPWWVYMFYVTIFFSVVYLLHYHVLGTGPSQAAEYNNEVEEARIAQIAHQKALEAKGQGFDLSKLAPLTDGGSIASGKSIYAANCASCHGAAGEGGVGPNLTDSYWIHGGDFASIYNTISNGVVAKGMIAWKTMLKPQKMQEVASYIETLQGTNPPNAKQQEGQLYQPASAAAGNAPAATDTTKIAPADTSATQQPKGN